jgi:hypothetical protein
MSALLEGFNIAVADTESSVDVKIGNVMVACKNARNKAVKLRCAVEIVLVNVNESAAIIYVIAKLDTLLKAYNTAVGCFKGLIDHIDESFGLSGTFFSDN